MQVNNSYKISTQPNIQDEEKPTFSNALEKFKQLEKGKTDQKAPQPIKNAKMRGAVSSSSSSGAAESQTSSKTIITTKKVAEPTFHKVHNCEPQPAPTSNVLVDSLKYYVGYGVFGVRLEGRQYEMEKVRLMERIQKSPSDIRFVGSQFQDDKDLALLAVQGYGDALYEVSERLKNDKDVVLAALKQDFDSYEYTVKNYHFDDSWDPPEYSGIGNGIWNNKEVVLFLVQRKGTLLNLVSEDLRNDREVALAAYQQCYRAQSYFGPAIWRNREAVLELVKLDGCCLKRLLSFRMTQRYCACRCSAKWLRDQIRRQKAEKRS